MKTVRIHASIDIVTDLPLADDIFDRDYFIGNEEDHVLDLATEAVRRALPCVSYPEVYCVEDLNGELLLEI